MGKAARTRRRLLGGLAAGAALCAVAGCAGLGVPGPARPAAAAAVVEFGVAVADAGLLFADARASGGLGRALASQTAAARAQFAPVVRAFNISQAGLRAVVVPDATYPPGEDAVRGGTGEAPYLLPNPQVCCRVGEPINMVDVLDLSVAVRDANLDTAALLPGVLGACTAPSGEVFGLPVDVGVCSVTFDGARLQSAGLAAPPEGGWSAAGLQAAALRVASRLGREALGAGLAWASLGTGPVWLGYLLGYGGSLAGDGRVTLASGAGEAGLEAYASLLAGCWDPAAGGPGAGAPAAAGPALAFRSVRADEGTGPWAARGLARFPVMPDVPAVPAVPLVASVPATAPRKAAGTAFAVWLLSPGGQRALTSVGYPPMGIGASASASWLASQRTGTDPADLCFVPSALLADGGSLHALDLSEFLPQALALPAPEQRAAALAAIQSAMRGLLSGDLSPASAAAAVRTAAAGTGG